MFIAASVNPASASRRTPARLTGRIPWKSHERAALGGACPCITPIGLPLQRSRRRVEDDQPDHAAEQRQEQHAEPAPCLHLQPTEPGVR
jgi:hypothetical protein